MIAFAVKREYHKLCVQIVSKELQEYMKKLHIQKHIFALHSEDLAYMIEGVSVGDAITIEDEDISRRAGQILRLERDDAVILFDQYRNITCTVIICSKTIFQIIVNEIKDNTVFKPYITVLLPLLKREALETALYNLTEIGVNKIQLILTQKVQRKWGGQKEYTRLMKIITSTAEQSKNYAFPDILEPLKLTESLERNPGEKYYFDVAKQPIRNLVLTIIQKTIERITIISGPEGGFTVQESQQIEKAGFVSYSLTPTVLRALHASTLAAGIVRSMTNENEVR